MLVLGRKEGERIVITDRHGEEIEILVARIKGDQVRLSFDAPQSFNIVRKELTNAPKLS